ncbi:hypothetical protein HZA39_01150 [Candidatus Peregrinibacteria bacterium]|nr:hypothetical protein [Candidatus Peregrinibacteria bacterium]
MEPDPQQFIALREAAGLSGKSEQTIRRAIKSKKLVVRKNRTAQGFVYLVDKTSLFALYKREDVYTEAQTPPPPSHDADQLSIREKQVEKEWKELTSQKSEYAAMREFQKLLRDIVEQHTREREHSSKFLRELQEKVMFLEYQVMMLQAPKRKWWKFWE